MITTDDALASLCEAVRAFPAIALDTEFVRTRTYYPQLGLIQLFDGEHLALIDPLGITDWSPLKAILRDPSITKFLHAGSEDLEVFLNVFGELPQPLIDTQILAAFCGRPMSWGFASMVEEYSGVTLDKSESRTDWLARPLTERQCEYAAADVWYLLPITAKLMVETEASGWLPAALDECRLMQMRRQEVVAPTGLSATVSRLATAQGARARSGGELCRARRAFVVGSALYAGKFRRTGQPGLIR